MTATALEPSTVLRIPRNLFLKMLEGYPEAAARLRDLLATRTDQAAHDIVNVRQVLDVERSSVTRTNSSRGACSLAGRIAVCGCVHGSGSASLCVDRTATDRTGRLERSQCRRVRPRYDIVLRPQRLRHSLQLPHGLDGARRRRELCRRTVFAALSLYITLFAIEFARAVWFGLGACGRADIPGSTWIALPLYLTLTQDWIYGIVCNNSLIFQYGQASQVSWSISLEVFLYAAYIVAGRWLYGASARRLVGIEAAAYALTVVGLLGMPAVRAGDRSARPPEFRAGSDGAEWLPDSLLQWLYYFNPAAHLAEFCGGVAAAALYLDRAAHAAPAGTLDGHGEPSRAAGRAHLAL